MGNAQRIIIDSDEPNSDPGITVGATGVISALQLLLIDDALLLTDEPSLAALNQLIATRYCTVIIAASPQQTLDKDKLELWRIVRITAATSLAEAIR